jgi:hypothetical protein
MVISGDYTMLGMIGVVTLVKLETNPVLVMG